MYDTLYTASKSSFRKEAQKLPKGSPELTQARRDEIINACAHLYETMCFCDVTIKEIAKFTSFTRPSIYNYFHTKEEIFLALLQREYDGWADELRELARTKRALSRAGFARILARSLEKRPRMLKLLSMNHYEMEANSSPERLAEFKAAYGRTMMAVNTCLEIFFPAMTEAERDGFIFAFFPFLFGIYPYTTVTDKQKVAMERAGMHFHFMTPYEMTYNTVMRLLGTDEKKDKRR